MCTSCGHNLNWSEPAAAAAAVTTGPSLIGSSRLILSRPLRGGGKARQQCYLVDLPGRVAADPAAVAPVRATGVVGLAEGFKWYCVACTLNVH